MKHNLAYSLDALIPGFYFWVGDWVLMIGGTEAEESYPFVLENIFGFGLILPNLKHFITSHSFIRIL